VQKRRRVATWVRSVLLLWQVKLRRR
jgi:hypothetical protein